MINLEDLTTDDLKDIEELQKLKKESEDLYFKALNQKAPLYLDDKNRFKVWSDSNNTEYLELKDGIWYWQARYLNQTYDVPIEKERLYKMHVMAYEFGKQHKGSCLANKDKEALSYFRSYVSRIK